MTIGEPTATAWLPLGVGLLMALSALLSRVSSRFGLPVFLLFLAVGMAAASVPRWSWNRV